MMTDAQRANDARPDSSHDVIDRTLQEPAAMDWMGEHLTDLRRTVAEHRIRKQLLWIGFVGGLLAHVAGYLLGASATSDLVGLLADLLYALGYALWTGVVVVLMVEIIPRAKERQIARAIDAYEATLRAKVGF